MGKGKRNNFVDIWIGHNRTGKSALVLELAKSYKKSHKKNKIISYDPQGRFKDVSDTRIYTENWEQFFNEKGQLTIYDTLFILDDYRGLMHKDTLDSKFLEMLMLRNEYGLDFCFVCHSPKLILERLSYYLTHVNLFYTSGDKDGFKASKKLMNIETIVQCREIINSYVVANNRGEYKKNGHHTFPFIRLDMEEENISLVNMPNCLVNKVDKNNIRIQLKNKQEKSLTNEKS